MNFDDALKKARQWRDEGACGPAAVVAIALVEFIEKFERGTPPEAAPLVIYHRDMANAARGIVKEFLVCHETSEPVSVELADKARAVLGLNYTTSTPSAGAAVGVIERDDVHGWHMNALVPWDKIGHGTKLYTAPAVAEATVPDGWQAAIENIRNRMDSDSPSACDNSGYCEYAGVILDCVAEELRALAAAPTPPAAQAGEEDRDPDACAAYCPRCGGTGDETELDGGGPDAREITVNCKHCLGSGLLINAYESLAEQLNNLNKRYMDVLGKLYVADVQQVEDEAHDRDNYLATQPAAIRSAGLEEDASDAIERIADICDWIADIKPQTDDTASALKRLQSALRILHVCNRSSTAAEVRREALEEFRVLINKAHGALYAGRETVEFLRGVDALGVALGRALQSSPSQAKGEEA